MQTIEPVVLFACTPNLSDLCALTVSLNGRNFDAWPTQPKILKCRELIFTEPDIIATPSVDRESCFNIILPKQLFKSGRLQARLKKNNMQITQPYRVTSELYQACLKYTMLAKLAPTWNKAGEWLIQGRDFLMHTGYANGVKFDFMVTADEQYASACATVLRIKPLQLNDLELSPLQVQSLMYAESHSAGEVSFSDHWCHVLPRMKRGRLCSLSLSIPKDSIFKAYKDIKRYWKNTVSILLFIKALFLCNHSILRLIIYERISQQTMSAAKCTCTPSILW
ncbi:uncharacterized protein C18orf63-like [Pomacea canaliculata]|uniref:uncharacterized protein C18orf63-like n=1 Tax=Pomacea canaliculata TaxID=400727 RepID=UPI000D727846|nr:uncharacterized protein C18orf63-like [Pomacea canaliculata]